MSNTYLKKGTHNANCDSCGVQFKADELKKDWRGFYLCKDDYEERHPQDFIRGVTEDTTVPFVRKEPDLTLTVTHDMTVSGTYSLTATILNTYDYTIVASAAASTASTLELPLANTVTAFPYFRVIRTDTNSLSTISLAVQSGDTLIGSTNITVGSTITLIKRNNTTWERMG